MAIKVLFIVLFSLICKSYYCSPSAFVERVFHCGWNTSEEKCMSSLVPASSGFHLSIAIQSHLIVTRFSSPPPPPRECQALSLRRAWSLGATCRLRPHRSWEYLPDQAQLFGCCHNSLCHFFVCFLLSESSTSKRFEDCLLFSECLLINVLVLDYDWYSANKVSQSVS